MKKKETIYKENSSLKNTVNEPVSMFLASPQVSVVKPKTQTKDFTYRDFKKIFDKSPFSQAEWAKLLFISERTLQRYAKDNSVFSGLHVERILHLEKLIDFGNEFFEEKFGSWLKEPLFHFKGQSAFDQLLTYNGINEVYTLIGRIQHGIAV